MNTYSSEGQGITEFVKGTTIEWLHGGRILALTTTAFGQQDVVKAYFDKFSDLVKSWESPKPMLTLLDFGALGITWTPYIRRRSQEFMELSKIHHITYYSAIVVPNSALTQIIRLFVRAAQRGPNQFRLFYQRDEGLVWLEDWLAKSDPGATP